ncbi:MAG: FtsK/SpoIIIE domain-containing protein, partial [Planctomycetota bacterium]
FEREADQLKEDRKRQLERLQTEYNQSWDALIHRWRSEFQAIVSECDEMLRFCESSFDSLEAIDWTQWSPPLQVPPAVAFGEYVADIEAFEGGLSDRKELQVDRKTQALPAVLSFPQGPSLLIEAEQQGRDRAIELMQQVMLRLLTSFPAGKVRFTIIDPVGLGQNFSAFMHLADYDERLVTNRIWTEAGHIQQRLADLTEHMENVIQKYLRNEFGSIQEYNQHAGEVAEPFQVLVIANFPTGFSEDTTRRLLSIASSGARCGVFTLISVDTKMKLPRNFDLADLEAHANTLLWRDERLAWKDPDLQSFPLTVQTAPASDITTLLIKAAGEHAVDANRVEVPFEVVVPTEDAWWSDDSRKAIEVPLGRAGATKLQYMQLGKGTSQHVLVAGKTGSGKSTLMHAIVTNLAIHYSPDELEFYLIDFKKGVEFKTYAEYQLPHARVIAIESEREFGLSVLERLDAELQERGDRFRASGAQSVEGFRDANPDERMPRVLLMVDEFQEFFVKDDKISNDASLLLDRLVRQGRAFGIHIVLGTQTLAGAYSLARSTIGQMAVRIALQCSEGDAHLILSEDNTAARLLNRPGEAIYNNANGLFEGNHPFQVVWLPDAQREDYLRKIQALARDRQIRTPAPIVFEGNVPADPQNNPLLARAIATPPTATPPPPPKAWLGAAVAIKHPTEIVFRRQSGSHLLMVGMQETLAAGIMTSAAIGLAATTNRGDGAMHYIVLDGGAVDSHEMNIGARLERSLNGRVTKPTSQELARVLAELDAEVTRRVEQNITDGEPQCLLVYNLSRFRDLRKADDDFGLGGFGEEETPTPSKMFANILREGPAVGIHAILWCDTFNNVSRWLDRQLLRDIAWRVLFQMSATDSSNLMDSAAASQLGANRAILYDDERGEFEKFRPYGLPSSEWLAEVAEQFDD